jgi:predicted esterase
MNRIALQAALALGLVLTGTTAAQQGKGYQAKVQVKGPTRLDWIFALSNKSLEKAPVNWLPADYDSAKQHYELFVPPSYDPKQNWPVVLFVPAGNSPAGWKEWESVCKKEGIIFASPYGAGNTVDQKPRIRIILDVLDDIRRQYSIDPDRTYIGGFSGGGRIAGGIAYSLPELFGGFVPVCSTGDIRDESWLQYRMIDRLSVALVTGETDFNRGECERFMFTWLNDISVRTRVWVVPKLGHGIPGGTTLGEVYQWLEGGLAKRRELAKKFPAMRIAGNAAPSRADLGTALLAEGKLRLQTNDTPARGVMLLLGCAIRFDGTPAGDEARKLCFELDAKAEKPWDDEFNVHERRFSLAQARALDAYASGPLPAQYAKQRVDMLKKAITIYANLLKDGKDARAVEEARKRIPVLLPMLKE